MNKGTNQRNEGPSRNADFLLIDASTKHNKYVLCQKLERMYVLFILAIVVSVLSRYIASE